MAVSPALIRLAHCSVTLGGNPALKDVTWRLERGEHWAVLGPNGAGKSTLLRLLRGEQRPDQDGKSRCLWGFDGGEDASPLAIRPLAALVSAELQRTYVRQGWRITGRELILSGFTDNFLPSFPSGQELEAAEKLAAALGAEALLALSVPAMSQGQLRLLLLARALVISPRLLLLDEAFDGLDKEARNTLRLAAERAAAGGTSLVCTAHRKEDLPACITHILCLDKGRVLYSGPADGAPEADGNGPEFREFTPPSLPPFALQGRPVLELEHADVYVDRTKVLHDINWVVEAGQNWRISGPNGAGKSTLLRALAGLEPVAFGGTLRWFGRRHPPLNELQRHVGYLSDRLHASYGYDLSGRELVWSGFDGSVGLYRDIRRKERESAAEWIALLGLEACAAQPLSRLSSGEAVRFFLARALVAGPRVLLLDEPCSGMDKKARVLFRNALVSAMGNGVQCLYVSHHDADVPPGVTRELALEGGRIAYSGLLRLQGATG
jgi:molybdate transport system ATP-binding protein